MFATGDHVWIEQGIDEFDIPKGCTILKVQKKKVQVQDNDGKVEWTTIEKIIKPIHGSSVTPLDNMIHFDDLQEYDILRNLHLRYKNQLIYTYIGDMLIALNPYQVLNIYSMNEVMMYSERKTDDPPPHIFATSDKSFVTMKNTRQNQCILISGESGAGKTESTKLILQYLTTISAGGHSWIKQQILEANPILEAFGNAKTQKNSNSSRFGKYINIHFNGNGEIEGARIDYYLLEKSRIVMQSKNERNYHIFYSLLAGLSIEEKQKLYLGNASDFKYLQGVSVCKDRDDAKTFADVKAAMKVLHYSEESFSNVVHLLAMILHLGNLKYKATTIAHADGTEIHDDVCLKRLGEFLGVNDKTLINALTKRSIFAKGEQVVSNLSRNQANEVRDAFAKIIYEKIFEKILEDINDTIRNPKPHMINTIGILDICGFENFDSNSFEQLCINYANERLQQFFVEHIFKIEQENYKSEGIFWNNVEYIDNQEIIDLIGVKPLNIMSLIDEESIFPKGSDTSLLSKVSLFHGTNSKFIKPKSSLTKEFGIVHFAGIVRYDVSGFLDKNRNILSGDFKLLIATSRNNFLKSLFFKNELAFDGDHGKRSVTLSTKFRDSLEALMSTLHNCNPFFVRCIKPNENQSPKVFDRILCCRQIRYSGLTETAKIRQAGYALRYNFSEFAQRFRALTGGINSERRQDFKYVAEKICTEILGEHENDFRFGHSKVFLKDFHGAILEQRRNEALRVHALIIQKNLKMWIARKRFLKLKNAAVVIQKTWKGYLPRKHYSMLRKAVMRLQSRARSRYHEAQFQKKRKIIISLQAECRRYLVQKWSQEKRKQIKMKKMKDLQNKISDSLKSRSKESRQLNGDSENNIDTMFDFLDNEPKQVSSRKVSDEIYTGIFRQDHTSTDSFKLTNDVNNLVSYDFYKFAAIYFTGNATPHFSKKPLKHSLLDLPHLSDQLAAKALSITIFRFMGDLPEPETPEVTESYNNKTVMRSISETLSKNYFQTDSFDKIVNQENPHFLRRTLKRKNKLKNIITKGIINDEYEGWLSAKRSNLEKLHFIIGHGILRPELKDEIYCQIVKQLINNPSKASHARGWVLLSLCVGCFAPSEKFITYLKSFIKAGPAEYAPFCEKRLDRSYRNGSRTQPPCWIEMQSVRYKEPMSLKISFMDGALKTVIADSASTAKEIVESLAEAINLKDIFGFSLFISIDDKVLSLGSENDHVMDAISQCEQYSTEQGRPEQDAPWRLLFRKEIFSPWHDVALDNVATNLIYHQICKGTKLGEYRCHKEQDLAQLMAQQLYIQYGSSSIPKNFKDILNLYIPNQILRQNSDKLLSKLQQLTIEAYQKITKVSNINSIKIKESVVSFAKETWPILFSRFYEANKIFGPDFDLEELIIAVNSVGIHFVDSQERILQQYSFPEISEVNYQKHDNTASHNLTISTIQREEFVFQSTNAESLASIVNYIMDGLRQRSTYVVATQDYINDADSILSLKKGDVIKLTDKCTGSTVMTSTWGSGEKHGVKGKFPCEYVYVLPTITKPSPQLTEMFKADFMSKSMNLALQELNHNSNNSKHHTLKKFANEHFRGKLTTYGSGISKAQTSTAQELWKHTREPIKAPLLSKLSDKIEQSKLAVQIFKNILKYMGDLPSNRQRIGTEYTDLIFGPALNDDLLRDEVYCQIMRQLTDNKVRLSEERGWELMWLATGIMPCSSMIRKELEQFLSSRGNIVAKDCLKRLERILATKTVRIYPPYILEVEAIRFKNLQIYHKVYFPDATDAAFEVHSSTRALDMCAEIAEKLQLHIREGFSLYFTIADRIISVPQYYFFFDFIREVIDWITRLRLAQISSVETKYQVMFIKKIWIDCLPGRDKNADSKFHFYQEAFKYLRGYHKCDKKDAVELASLIYISGHAHNKEELSQIDQKLQEYIPADMIRLMSPKEWKKRITAAYNHKKNLTQYQAKEAFLQCVYQWPTFGSAFFEVRQTSDTKFPSKIVVAINKSGVSVIDPQSKEILSMYSFTEITNWSSGDTYFHMTIGNFMNGRKLLCETSLGYKMDDLITSYINYLQGNTGAVRRLYSQDA